MNAAQTPPTPTNDPLTSACGTPPDGVCKLVYERTNSEWAARVADIVVEPAIRLVVVGVVIWAISRFGRRVAARSIHRILEHNPRTEADNARTGRRIDTLVGITQSTITFAAVATFVLVALAELQVHVGPLLAGAGIAGVALGFGAQNLVRDVLAGFFMVGEDHYGVGDVIDLNNGIVGTVEGFSLRNTRLRDVNGTVWNIPNGQIVQSGNLSHQWASVVLDVPVGYDTDLDAATAAIEHAIDLACTEETIAPLVVERPSVLGVQQLGADAIMIRVVGKVGPGEQMVVARALNRQLRDHLLEAGIEIPFAQRTVWLRQTPTLADPDAEKQTP